MEPVLVCPGCRVRTEGRLDLRTLEPAPGGDALACACGRRYPVVDGVPIVMAAPASYLRSEIASIVERDLSPELAALLVADGPDDAPYPRLLEHLSIYLDAHWGDRATPPQPLAVQAVLDKIADRPRVAAAVELGCSTGRVAAALADGAEQVVGLDLHFGALRRARRILAGERVAYARRMIGRHYAPATIAAPPLAARPLLVCGDALDPPLVPGAFDRVVALNLLDSVADPGQLLAVLDGLCAPGGELLLASPYAWQSSVMAEHARFGGASPDRDLADALREGVGIGARYRIEDEADLPWTLRRDARSSATYSIHYLRARKM